VTDGWDRAITDSNAANDTLTIYPPAPANPTNGATLYIVKDVVYPVNFFDPTTQQVDVGKLAGVTLSPQAGTNINDVFNNGGSSTGTSDRISAIGGNVSTIATNLGTPTDFGSGATVAANIKDASGMMAFGTCDAMSTTTTCRNASLTQADNYWTNWTMIIVAGQPARCIRSFIASTDQLGWPQALPSTAASQKFVLLAAPECRNAP
jgi:hypothetical protein